MVTRARQDRLLALLLRNGAWATASVLADTLGVTPRSVRSYVTALNARVDSGAVVESGPLGYRAGAGASAAWRPGESDASTPRDRLHTVVRALLDSSDGIDVFETADRLHVSPATLEADLARVRGLLGGTALVLERSAERARLSGTEAAQRRLLSTLAHDEMDAGSFDLEALRRALGVGSAGAGAFGQFKVDLVQALSAEGYFVNEIGISDVLMHIAIAADRVSHGHPLESVSGHVRPATDQIAGILGELTERHLGIRLGAGDRRHLATLVSTRVVAPGAASASEEARAPLDPDVEASVRAVVTAAAAEFLVDIAHEDFIVRLALHVQNLRLRAQEQAWSRNPLTRSLKSTYPMMFEVAVFIASGLNERLGIPILDDEIAYIAMHVGGRLERSRRADHLLTATIVCPGYYELHELLRSSVDRSLGQAVEVVGVETRIDPDWDSITTDLVLTTIDPPAPNDRVVRIQPFLTDADVERVQNAAGRVRRGRRLARLRTELERYFDAEAFVRGVDANAGEDGVIRQLGERLVARGVIDENYIERTIERERLSSTAFTDALAVPHAMGMTASRTAIAIGIAEPSMTWGDGRVQVIALVAFSESDREAFQTVFEQFVEVFSERDSVQRIVRRGTDFPSFLDELVAVIDG
ncbi:lichenan operon transcriptional antiterminator [Microbacterium endophyticum]|uniref:Lichenan operon transcriptional antiterminator n=1 Tax=Microbacterium endophyticum TaxID=1526412 RepID=A0A7W4YNA3_9MICO|nr:PTS sugar transporter subunit IIA [Microbacterium endophyticum]MBB2976374.1 lichenan operon transcriptional antiterminator [Microbacterium endophyticum]NIK35255.1 lichenan operon transcriptional antiterminator [Microbacterium endophyticum]